MNFSCWVTKYSFCTIRILIRLAIRIFSLSYRFLSIFLSSLVGFLLQHHLSFVVILIISRAMLLQRTFNFLFLTLAFKQNSDKLSHLRHKFSSLDSTDGDDGVHRRKRKGNFESIAVTAVTVIYVKVNSIISWDE